MNKQTKTKKWFSNVNFYFQRFIFKFKNGWRKFWETKEITKKLIYTICLLSLYLIATTIISPFVKIASNQSIQSDTFLNTLNLVGGGGLKNFSLMALGLGPFINASLIMSLLQTRLFPPIQKLSQSGPQGRRKINVITRILTFIIAIPQAIFLTTSLKSGKNPFIELIKIEKYHISENLIAYFILPMILIGGSLFALFIAEQITDKGLGNGTSLIIFVGIAFQLPDQFRGAFEEYIDIKNANTYFIGSLKFLTYLFSYLLLIFVISFIYNSERHIPIQQIGAGRSRNITEMGKLPIKVNPGGIMPIIFASMILSFPLMIARLLPDSNAKTWMETYLSFKHWVGLTLLVIVTFFFSFVMGIQQSRVDKIAEDFTKNSTFIPGIRPGEETEDYLIGVVLRLSAFSGIWLVILGSIQSLQIMTGILPERIAFGGTGMMILVSVSLETIQQFKARLKTNRLAKQKRMSLMAFEKSNDNLGNIKKGDGLLW
ncbi:MAG: preprotein translocase subunit SecY [Metamycoplasmataceae bacterium]